MLNAKPLGLIDTLGEGFASLNRHLWILLLPIALDLLFAFGPGVSMGPVADRAVTSASGMLSAAGTEAGDDEDAANVVNGLRENLEGYRDANFLGVLAWQLPSVMSVASQVALPKIAGPVIAEIDSTPMALGYGMLLAALGLAGTSVYLTILAQAVRTNPVGPSSLGATIAHTWLRLVTLFAMLVVIGVPATVIGVLLVQAIGMLGPAISQMLTSLMVALLLLAAFYAFFLQNALVLLGLWPLPAALASARVIRRNFWTAMGFIVLVTVIGTGMPLIWRMIIENPVGAVAAILGHSYISSGLAAAGMLFFWQRYDLPLAAARNAQYPPRGA